MIRKNTLKCKLFSLLFLGRDKLTGLYSSCGAPYVQGNEQCPTCGCVGACSEHGFYSREIIDFVCEKVISRRIWVTRVKCASCGHTHALLAGTVVPYNKHSLLFILHVLYARFCKGWSLSKIYGVFGIGARTFYRWAGIFASHCDEWLGRLKAVEAGSKNALMSLLGIYPYARFAASFFRKTNLSFLQSHANPANCRQVLPAFPGVFDCSHNTP